MKLPETLNVLLVDDEEINLIITSRILENLGVKPDTAINGEQALDKVADNIYDIIFMDIRMPVLSGDETVKLIRKFERHHNREKSVIIALTADGMNRKERLSCGFDDVFIKPVAVSIIKSIIESVLNN